MALVLAFVGCLPVTAQQPSAADEPPPQEIVLPDVDLEGLEPQIAEQLRSLREGLPEVFASRDPEQITGALANLGRHYHAYELFDAAAACYRAALTARPEETTAYLLAHVERERGDLEEALRLFSIIAARQPDNGAARYYQAEVLFSLGRFDASRASIPEGAESAPFLVLLGRLALEFEEPGRAVAFFQRALERQPEADRTWYLLAQAHRANGDRGAAAEALQRYGPVGARPVDPLMDRLLELRVGSMPFTLDGRQAFAAGDYAAAVELFRQALAGRPEDVGAKINLASALAEVGETEEALDLLRDALTLRPDDDTILFNLGVLLLRQNLPTDAEPYLRRAAELEPEDLTARRQWIISLARSGRPGDAAAAFRAYHHRPEFSEELRLEEIQLLLDAGEAEAAVERLSAALEELPSSGRIARAGARLLAAAPATEVRDGMRALELATMVHEATGDPLDALHVSLALAELGRCDDARRWLEVATEGGDLQLEEWQRDFGARLRSASAPASCRP